MFPGNMYQIKLWMCDRHTTLTCDCQRKWDYWSIRDKGHTVNLKFDGLVSHLLQSELEITSL